MPSRCRPRNDIQWSYVIDLDQNVFRVSDGNYQFNPDLNTGGVQYFRLDNIPRWLFALDPVWAENNDDEMVHPVMAATRATVQAEHWADNLRQIPTPKPELLELYQSFSTHKQPFFCVPPGPNIPTWKYLQLQLLHQLVNYFRHAFNDIIPSRKCSMFVRRQLTYAVLSLTRSAGMKFHGTNVRHKIYYGNADPEVRTPSWEPPTTDSYWFGDVFILLTEHIYFRHGQPTMITKAEIAKAVQLATTKDSFTNTVAILFSVSSIIIVNIYHTPHGLEVSHSYLLPLLDINDRANAFGTDLRRDSTTRRASLGIEALMNLFSSRPLVPPSSALVARPGNLPTEICERVFRYADPSVQHELERTCREFRDIAAQYPRIGEWTILKCTGEYDFIARRGSSGSTHVVRVEALGKVRARFFWEVPVRSVFEVGLWGAGEKVQLNMPLVSVVEIGGCDGGSGGWWCCEGGFKSHPKLNTCR